MWYASGVRWLVALLIVAGACGKQSGVPAPAGKPRVVSLTPSATEVMAALGATDLLVGVDQYSEYPPEVKALPKVGSFMTPNLEAIVALKPTLVIVDDIHAGAAGSLEGAGIHTVACAIHALADVESALTTVGAQIGKTDQAQQVAAQIEQAKTDALAHRPAVRPKVLAIIDREADGLGNLVAAGTGSYVDELLALVGAANALAEAGVRYPKLSMEEVLRAQPDVILDLSFAARGPHGLDPWQTVDVPAVKAHRVRALTDAYLIAPSPRVAAALHAMADAIKADR